jgi:16S rRNA (cytosine967-C5)-methyltransferase
VRSHPLAFVEALRKQFDDATAGAILLRNNLRPVITLRVDADALDVPVSAGLVAHDSAERFLVAAGGWNDVIEGLVARGKLSPQDPTAAKPVRRVAAMAAAGEIAAPRRVLDLCAGLGTKTMQLARAFPDAAVVATDVEADKLKRLEARAKQMGAGGKNVETREIAEVEKGGKFDLVLVDVPCSNTGVMSRRVQSRWRWPTLDHAELAKLQQKLIGQAVGLTAAGGSVVYSTCSIMRDENQERVAKAVAEVEGVKVAAEEATVPSLDVGAAGMFDGGYFAVLKAQ